MARQNMFEPPSRKRLPIGLKTGLLVGAFAAYSALLGGYCSYNAKERPDSFSAQTGHLVARKVFGRYDQWKKERAERLQKEELERKRQESLDEIVQGDDDDDNPPVIENGPVYRFGQKDYMNESPFDKYRADSDK